MWELPREAVIVIHAWKSPVLSEHSCVVRQREKAAMPWTTLVLLEGGALYVKQRLARALQLWAR